MNMVIIVFASGLMIWAACTDLASRRIPNRISLAIAVLGLARIIAGYFVPDESPFTEVSPVWDIAAAFIVFVAGSVLFNVGLLGGGDVKLAAAGTLLVGASGTLSFLLATAVAGGILAVAFMTAGVMAGSGWKSHRYSLPYGVAIAAGCILVTTGVVPGT